VFIATYVPQRQCNISIGVSPIRKLFHEALCLSAISIKQYHKFTPKRFVPYFSYVVGIIRTSIAEALKCPSEEPFFFGLPS
jgi:hypothetical protein